MADPAELDDPSSQPMPPPAGPFAGVPIGPAAISGAANPPGAPQTTETEDQGGLTAQAMAALQETQASLRANRQQSTDVNAEINQSLDHSRQIERGRQEAMNPASDRAIAALNRPLPRPPGPPPANRPPPMADFAQPMQEWAAAVAMIGLIGSAFARVSSTAALNAFAGGVQGMNQGNMQAFERNYRIWQEQNNQTIQRQRALVDQYMAVLQNRQLDNDQMRQQLMLIAQRWQAQQDYETLRREGLTGFARNLQQQERGLERLQAATLAIQQRHETQMAQAEARIARAAAQARVNNIYSPEGMQWMMQLPLEQRRFVMYVLQNRRPDIFEQLQRAAGQNTQQPNQQQQPPPMPLLPGDPGYNPLGPGVGGNVPRGG